MKPWSFGLCGQGIPGQSLNVLSSFQKNKEQDLAILALLLASGVRLSEAVNLDLRDVNLNMMMIEVTRKGASGTRSMWQVC